MQAARPRETLGVLPTATVPGSDRRSWWCRPRSAGLAFSCLFHAQFGFVLALIAWGSPRSIDEPESITALLDPPAARPVELELSPLDVIGGEGGPTQSVAGFDKSYAAVGLGIGAEPRLPLLALPEKPIVGMNPGPGVGRGRGTGHGDGTGSQKPAGKNAVTEGSFTVWTEPDDPIPGETYTIMIEVKLPEKVTRYPRHDLVGLVTGTDGWEQQLPGNAKPLQQYLPVHNHTVQLEVDVPGAGRRVRDTIQVRSKLLKEEQVLKIVF